MIGIPYIVGAVLLAKFGIPPTIRQISILKIPAIFDLNRRLQGFDNPGVADVSFRCPNRICKKSIAFDRLNILKVSAFFALSSDCHMLMFTNSSSVGS